MERGDLPSSERDYRRALVVKRALGDQTGVGRILGSLAEILALQKDFVGAQDQFEQALAIARNHSDPEGQVLALEGLSRLYHRKEDPQKGDEYSKLAEEMRATLR